MEEIGNQIMANKIQIKRGEYNTLPILSAGEPAFCTDTKQVYIGDGVINYQITYTHPTHSGDDINIDSTTLTGATVISDLNINITTDTSGHVTDANATLLTRTLTLSDLGYTSYSLPIASTLSIGGIKSGTDITVDDIGNVSVNDDSHNHIISNVDDLQTSLDNKANQITTYTKIEVDTQISNLVDSSPTTLDTLNELANALGDDPNFATTVSTNIGTKLTKTNNLSDLSNISIARTNLGVDIAGTINYIHPTYSGDDINIDSTTLTGATVISDLNINITTDTSGHVTDANATLLTRTLTLADLGYTGETNANNYIHPSYTARTESGDTGSLTGATVISDLDFNITIDTSGHVTACDITTLLTRTLTLADLGYTGETNATADQTSSEILTSIKTVDGTGSGLDSDLLDGQHGSYYTDASNLTGIIDGGEI